MQDKRERAAESSCLKIFLKTSKRKNPFARPVVVIRMAHCVSGDYDWKGMQTKKPALVFDQAGKKQITKGLT